MRSAVIPQINNWLNQLPSDKIVVVYDFVAELLRQDKIFWKQTINSDIYETMLASEAALGRDWNRPEEDEAWKDL